MRTLWTYGCSHTDGFRKEENIISTSRPYIAMYGDEARINWTNHLADKMKCELNNQGDSGVGNDYIFKQFCKTFYNIRRGDTVIVQWTYINRFMFASPYDESTWVKVVPHTLLEYDGFDKQTQQEIMDNRNRPQWLVETKERMDMISYIANLIGFNLYFWSADERLLYNDTFNDHRDKCIMYEEFRNAGSFFGAMSLFGCQTIREETNEVIPDPHLSVRGNQIVADKFYEHIRKNQPTLFI
jgi:hypothetical protein